MGTTVRTDVTFASADGHTTVSGHIWQGQDDPKAVVQLVHGMAEHILRYEPFAEALCDAGFVVCGHDHVGHGASVATRADLGHLPAKGGADILVEDTDRMRHLMQERVGRDLPYFLFGHSMGSFVVRNYVALHPEGLSGAIICGTGQMAASLIASGQALARTIAATRGERHVSKLLGDLSLGSYAKAIQDRQSEVDWLSFDRDNIKAYLADARCGFPFTAGGNVALMDLTARACSAKNLAQVPDGLPLFYIAGDGDPVGDMGKGVRERARQALAAGKRDVTCKIFEHRRHEILNDAGKEEVMQDIIDWMEERL